MDCPICGAPAKDLPNAMDGKSISCSSCGDYDVAGSVYDSGKLQELEPEWRQRALGKARRWAESGKRPKITTYSL